MEKLVYMGTLSNNGSGMLISLVVLLLSTLLLILSLLGGISRSLNLQKQEIKPHIEVLNGNIWQEQNGDKVKY